MKKIYEEKIEIVQDGEIIQKRKIEKNIIESEPPYIKMYLEDVMYICGAPKGDIKVLFAILKQVNFGENKVVLISSTKKEIAKQTGMSLGSINNAIMRLAKAKIIIPVDRSIYVLNPYFFGRTSWAQIKDMRLKLQIEYDAIRGRTYQALIHDIRYTQEGLQFQKFIEEIDRELQEEIEQIEQEDPQETVIKIFKEHGINIETAPDVIQILSSHPNQNIEKVACVLSEMVKNGNIQNPVGFIRKDKEWKIKQVLEDKIKPNQAKKEKTTPERRWFHQEYELYDPLEN